MRIMPGTDQLPWTFLFGIGVFSPSSDSSRLPSQAVVPPISRNACGQHVTVLQESAPSVMSGRQSLFCRGLDSLDFALAFNICIQ